MIRYFLFVIFLIGLVACNDTLPQMGTDGKPLPKLYWLENQDPATIQFRFLDSLNALRAPAGLPALRLNAKLNAAAATHARDMSVQNRPWHFGSDGSSPIDRVSRAGYAHELVGEVISETFETELETLSAWVKDAETRNVLLDKKAQEMGFYWYQEPSGKIWWTLVLGSGPVLTSEKNLVLNG